MLATTAQNLVHNFDKTCDSVIQNCEPIIITRDSGSNVVLVSQADYDNLLENLYIRESPSPKTQETPKAWSKHTGTNASSSMPLGFSPVLYL